MEEHLQSCIECEKAYTSMKEEMKLETLEVDKTVDYMKKVNKKMKIALKGVVAIILLIMLAFWANTLRDYRILEELRQIQNDENKDYSYEFENIDDEISEEPNREEYELSGKKF